MQRSFSQIGQIATIQSKENAYTHLCFESIDFVSIHPDLQLPGKKIDLPGEACLFDTRIFRSMLIDSNGSFLGLVIFFITVIFYSGAARIVVIAVLIVDDVGAGARAAAVIAVLGFIIVFPRS